MAALGCVFFRLLKHGCTVYVAVALSLVLALGVYFVFVVWACVAAKGACVVDWGVVVQGACSMLPFRSKQASLVSKFTLALLVLEIMTKRTADKAAFAQARQEAQFRVLEGQWASAPETEEKHEMQL